MDLTEIYEALGKATAVGDSATVKSLSEYVRSVEASLKPLPPARTELDNASELWHLLEAVIQALRITPDHELRTVANEVIAQLIANGSPRLLHLAEFAAAQDRRNATPRPN